MTGSRPVDTGWKKPLLTFGAGAGFLIIVIALVSLGGGKSKSKSVGSSPRIVARVYVRSHAADAYRVKAMVANVQDAVGLVKQSPTTVNVGRLAQVAQTAHDGIDNLRTNFTYSDKGALGQAEGNVLLGADDLKNAMGAMVAYAGNPNPATLAHLTIQYGVAASEWNDGVRVIWRIARRAHPPAV